MLDVVSKTGATVPALWLADIETLPIEIDARTNVVLGAELTLARRFAISAYDAAYLELAFRKNLSLMTRDKRLGEAASNLGLLWKP